MERLLQGLMNLGLARKEAQVYLALVQLGRGSAQEIAKKAGIKRPTTYVIVLELMKKGLVLKIPAARKQMFSAKPPQELLATAEGRMKEARSVIPSLEALVRAPEKVRTLYFEGIVGVKEALYYRLSELKGKEIVAFFGNDERAAPELTTLFHEWNKDVFENGTKIRSIAPSNKTLTEYRQTDKTYGFLAKIIAPQFYTSQCGIDINPLFVRITMFKEQQAVIVESADVAKALLEIFEMVFAKY